MYVTEDEFECPCGECENKIDPAFVTLLGAARERACTPFIITSGYRCEAHNTAIGGSATSSHLKGCAADIAVKGSRERWLILEALIRFKFTRLGIGEDFIHVDIDSEKAQDVIWDYYPE